MRPDGQRVVKAPRSRQELRYYLTWVNSGWKWPSSKVGTDTTACVSRPGSSRRISRWRGEGRLRRWSSFWIRVGRKVVRAFLAGESVPLICKDHTAYELTGRTTLLRRWINVNDVDSTSQQLRVTSGNSSLLFLALIHRCELERQTLSNSGATLYQLFVNAETTFFQRLCKLRRPINKDPILCK